MNVNIKFCGTHTKLPMYMTQHAAAVDLIADVPDEGVLVWAGEIRIIPTGISVAIPEGYAGLVLPRSGQSLAYKGVANSPGLIDSDYRAEIGIIFENKKDEEVRVQRFERLAQLMFIPYVSADFNVVDELDETARGTGGFGHTGSF